MGYHVKRWYIFPTMYPNRIFIRSRNPLVLRDLDLYKDILFEKYERANDNAGFVQAIKRLYEEPQAYEAKALRSKEISEYYCKENVLKIWREFYSGIYKHFVNKG